MLASASVLVRSSFIFIDFRNGSLNAASYRSMAYARDCAAPSLRRQKAQVSPRPGDAFESGV